MPPQVSLMRLVEAICFENEINFLIIIYQLFGEGAPTLERQRFQNILYEFGELA